MTLTNQRHIDAVTIPHTHHNDAALPSRIEHDDAFQNALRRYAQANGSSARVASAASDVVRRSFEPAQAVVTLRLAMISACSALRSYQYGNTSPDLAQEIADHLDDILAKTKAQES